MIKWIIIVTSGLLIAYLYFYLAKKYEILDRPNDRSSHIKATIRGGGILFSISALVYFCFEKHIYPYFFSGLLVISIISFWDDIKSLSNRIRLSFHLISIILLFIQLGIFSEFGLIPIFVLTIFSVGILNAYNFMDGINGLTGLYSLVGLLNLFILDKYFINFTESNLIIYIILSVSIFLFFNFRSRAICFSGDVGSISMAFLMLFLIYSLIDHSGNIKFIFFLFLYGLDSIYTIVYRILNKENIFKAHRSHFYQILVHNYKYSHLSVATFYGILQLFLNVWIIIFEMDEFIFYIPFIAVSIGMEFVRNSKHMSISSMFFIPDNKKLD